MKNKKAFTLIEMVITITVIIILSAISVPIYKNYQQDAILAEGYILLSAIRDAQKNYYSEYGNFLIYGNSSTGTSNSGWTNNEEVLGIDARGNKYFTCFNVCYSIPGLNLKNAFGCEVKKPKELKSSNDTSLILQYNMTLGQRIIDYPKTSFDAWN